MMRILEKTILSWMQIVSDPFVLTIKYIDLKHSLIEPLRDHLLSCNQYICCTNMLYKYIFALFVLDE